MSIVDDLIATYEEYIKLLAESESILFPIAHIHGYCTPENLVQRGKELRDKIAKLRELVELEK